MSGGFPTRACGVCAGSLEGRRPNVRYCGSGCRKHIEYLRRRWDDREFMIQQMRAAPPKLDPRERRQWEAQIEFWCEWHSPTRP